ncbi:lipopolysaccharide biosynthesis protein [Aeromonas caviae]
MDNKKHNRIVKNSLFLYFRMILTLVVTLYTSRVVLNVLGVEDFGIYNVVGGVVTMMAFLSGAMSSATQRFLSFELGKGDVKQLDHVFKMSINIHLLVILIIVLLAETLGLWFVNAKLVIPVERIPAANWVFHCALFSFCCTVISVPYNAAIIAYERMSAFAYVSIIDVILKLVVVTILMKYGDDKLELYASLLSLVSIIIFFCYYFYVGQKLPISKFNVYWDAELFRTLFGYTGWNLFGNLAVVMSNQGVNILLNIFFGAHINAARAIAIQVNGAISGFVGSLQMAINPQITKAYAIGDFKYMHILVYSGARYTFFLLLFLSLPVFIESKGFLALWLGEVPQYADIFVKLILIESGILCLSGTLMTSAQATGRIKLYQSVVGSIQLLNIPLSFMLLTVYSNPSVVYYISISVAIFALMARLFFLQALIKLDLKEFFKSVISPLLITTVVSLLLINYLLSYIDNSLISNSLLLLCVKTVLTLSLTSISILFFGLRKDEVQFLFDFIKTKILKIRV